MTVAWQGGEPTLMKLEFFERAVELVEKYRQPGQTVQQTFQTNGLLLDDAWCAFFKKHNFLVGLSVDGPRELHDAYRRDRRGQGTFDLVMRGWRFLRKHGVEFNILCTVNAANQAHGREGLSLLPRRARREVDAVHSDRRAGHGGHARHRQPGLERSRGAGGKRLLYTQTGDLVTERSVGGEQYGRFLIDIFEEWVRRDVGKVFVQLFDVTLEAYFGRHLLCIHAPTCGYGPALEHNGDLYTCDHFVEPGHKLGNIHDDAAGRARRLAADAQVRRRQARHADQAVPGVRRALPLQRRLSEGPVRAVAGRRARPQLPLRRARTVLHPHPPADGSDGTAPQARAPARRRDGVAQGRGREARSLSACPCGSGRKFKFCHGDKARAKAMA